VILVAGFVLVSSPLTWLTKDLVCDAQHAIVETGNGGIRNAMIMRWDGFLLTEGSIVVSLRPFKKSPEACKRRALAGNRHGGGTM
jgi:hypothetical protein